MHPATPSLASLQNSSTPPAGSYESDRALQEYLLFHYGASEELLPYEYGPHGALNFAVRCVSGCIQPNRLKPGARALDLGCAVGRSCYELARWCTEVVGVDYSHRFIAAAEQIRSHGSIRYASREEGEKVVERIAHRPAETDWNRIRFEQGDAMNLGNKLGMFEVVLMANLVDRLSDPARCLRSLAGLVQQGGQLVITSPYTWMEEFTPKQNWLCADASGQSRSSLEGMADALGHAFRLERTGDLPFLIREHARKYQWSVAQASCWTRVD